MRDDHYMCLCVKVLDILNILYVKPLICALLGLNGIIYANNVYDIYSNKRGGIIFAECRGYAHPLCSV